MLDLLALAPPSADVDGVADGVDDSVDSLVDSANVDDDAGHVDDGAVFDVFFYGDVADATVAAADSSSSERHAV